MNMLAEIADEVGCSVFFVCVCGGGTVMNNISSVYNLLVYC